MHIRAGSPRKAFEEVMHKFSLQITHANCADFRLHDRYCASAEIYGSESESLVHGHQEVACPQDAPPVAQCAVKDLAERNAHIFHRVVLVYVQISAREKLQIETTMPREEFQHVIEKTNPGRDFVLSPALDHEINMNLSFGGLAEDVANREAYLPES